MKRSIRVVVLLISSAFLAFPAITDADHSWEYHWARTATLSPDAGDGVSPRDRIRQRMDDWSASSVLDTVVTGDQQEMSSDCRARDLAQHGNNGYRPRPDLGHGNHHAGRHEDERHVLNTATYGTGVRNLWCARRSATLGLDHRTRIFPMETLTCMDYAATRPAMSIRISMTMTARRSTSL
jgi:hypothetical protein